MRPQRIVCKLSLNLIIHLTVKLNYEKILENGSISKEKWGLVISLKVKSKESDSVFLAKICMWFTVFQRNIRIEITSFLTIFISEIPLKEIIFTEKRIVFIAPSTMKTMLFSSLIKEYLVIISDVLKYHLYWQPYAISTQSILYQFHRLQIVHLN